jgi:hypothetical protein
MPHLRAITGGLAIASALMLSACEKPKELSIANPVIRLAANPNAPAVAYFDIKGGPTDDRLLMVTSPLVIRVELHESMMSGNMASMKPIEGGIAIPANTDVPFKQGGKHAMLFNINPSVKPGNTVQMNFTFTSGLTMQAYAPVRAAGDIR